MARTYASEYARRNALAQSQGFSSYADKRSALRYANQSDEFKRQLGQPNSRDAQDVRAVRVYYEAFAKKEKHEKPMAADGWIADWYCDYVGTWDRDEWKEKYGAGD
jgi:hypothetical protein